MASQKGNSRIQGLFKDFPVLFKAGLIFKDFSRKPSKFKYFQACVDPGVDIIMSKYNTPKKIIKYNQMCTKQKVQIFNVKTIIMQSLIIKE